MNPDHILLSPVKNADRLCGYFDACMVDVAYATKLPGNAVKVEVEADVDLQDAKTFEWLASIIQTILNEHGETDARLDFVKADSEEN